MAEAQRTRWSQSHVSVTPYRVKTWSILWTFCRKRGTDAVGIETLLKSYSITMKSNAKVMDVWGVHRKCAAPRTAVPTTLNTKRQANQLRE